MQEKELHKRAVFAKWFLLIALLPLLTLIIGSVPAIVAATGGLVPQWLLQKALFTTMFFVPLLAIFFFLPLVKLMNRSILWWGVGLVVLPMGVYILGACLLYLAARYRFPGSEEPAASGTDPGQNKNPQAEGGSEAAGVTANAKSWQRKPFKAGVPLDFPATFSAQEFAHLRRGLIPQAMEDKWFVYYDQPYLYFHRSWTGLPAYRLALAQEGEGARVTEALWTTDLAATEGADLAYESSLLDFLIANLLLGQAKPFPVPAGLEQKIPGVLQHHMAGTGYREIEK